MIYGTPVDGLPEDMSDLCYRLHSMDSRVLRSAIVAALKTNPDNALDRTELLRFLHFLTRGPYRDMVDNIVRKHNIPVDNLEQIDFWLFRIYGAQALEQPLMSSLSAEQFEIYRFELDQYVQLLPYIDPDDVPNDCQQITSYLVARDGHRQLCAVDEELLNAIVALYQVLTHELAPV